MDDSKSIAVVGYAYRAPECGRKGLWELLVNGRSAWSRVPKDRWNEDSFHHPDSERPGFVSSEGGYFLPDDVHSFDAAFFNLKANEARDMNPQHRMLLECVFEAAESAGVTMDELLGSDIGVFAANEFSDHTLHMLEDLSATSHYTALGTSASLLANRVSYFFGLTGPSIVTDAACSSSAYAIHVACQSLLAGDCTAAFVGGAKVLDGPACWSTLNTLGATSSSGKCFSYDTRAGGFGKGEGGGCILLKRLPDALAAGDTVQAIVRNTATGHSGQSQGITKPSQIAQERLLRRVHAAIGLDPADTTFVEGHGTGTPVGDPVDANAVMNVIGRERSPSNPVYLGSVKSNFGHLEGASGLISVIKCITMLENGMLLPNADFEKLNSSIENSGRIQVLKKALPWPTGRKKRICVTNFGFGGSNAALLLDGAKEVEHQNKYLANGATPTVNGDSHTNGDSKNHRVDTLKGAHQGKHLTNEARPTVHNYINGDSDHGQRAAVEPTLHNALHKVFVFSAKSVPSLESYLDSFAEYLAKPQGSLSFAKNLSYTLGQRRTHFNHRCAVTADSSETLREKLLDRSNGVKVGKVTDPVLAFSFTGQGAQYAQMAAGLQQYEPFQQAIQRAERLLTNFGASWSLSEELSRSEAKSRINEVEISQPVCTAIQIALVLLLRSWNVLPTAVTGHSSGEIAAAFAAGFLSFEAAIAVAFFRGIAAREVQDDPSVKGAMLALGVGYDEAMELIKEEEGYAVVAAINSPDSVTISGDVPVIDNIQQKAQHQGLFVRRLKVGVAYHSRQMEAVAASYLASIEKVCDHKMSPTAIFASSVTGRKESVARIQPSYWVENLISPVRYVDAIEALFADGDDTGNNPMNKEVPNVILEIGPHSALQNPTKQILQQIDKKTGRPRQGLVIYIPSLIRGKDAQTALLKLVESLFTLGLDVNLSEVNQTTASNSWLVKDLPAYEWNKTTRYIHENRITMQKLHHGRPYDELLGWKSPYSEGNEHSFRNVFTLDDLPYLRDHKVSGEVLLPFTAFVSLAIKALTASSTASSAGMSIRELHITKSLSIEEGQRIDLTTKTRPAMVGTEIVSPTLWNFEIMSWLHDHGWTVHAYGLMETEQWTDLPDSISVQIAAEVLNDGPDKLQEVDVQEEYVALEEKDLGFGPTFHNITQIWQAPGLTVHEVQLRQLEMSSLSGPSPAVVDPPTLDAFVQIAQRIQQTSGVRTLLLPSFCRQWRIPHHFPSDVGSKFYVVTRHLNRDEKSGTVRLSSVVFSAMGGIHTPVMEIDDFVLKTIQWPNTDRIVQGLPETYLPIEVPHVDYIGSTALCKLLTGPAAPESQVQDLRALNDAGKIFIHRMLAEVAAEDLSDSPPHLKKFLSWSQRLMSAQASSVDQIDEAAVMSSIAGSAPGKLISRVGNRLPDILRGKVEPLELMLEDNLLSQNYEEDVSSIRGGEVLARYVQHLAQTNPDLNILEIGGGTASATQPVLKAIAQATDGNTSLFRYTFTDISSGFFEDARKKLSQWTSKMSYQKLDIGQDPATQGFQPQSYDLIIASNVLHATANMVTTIKNVHSLLKPNGKLALLEVVQAVKPLSLPFAVLPGWWLSEDKYRSEDGPVLSKDTWNELLKEHGFTGVEGTVDDYPGEPEHLTSVLWSTKIKVHDTSRLPTKTTICSCFTEYNAFASFVEAISAEMPGPVNIKNMAELDIDADTLYIVLDDPRRSILSDLSEDQFENFQKMVTNASRVLWVSPESTNPEGSFIRGFFRTLRLEDISKQLFVVEKVPYNSTGATIIGQLVTNMQDEDPTTCIEQEFSVVDGLIHVPRLQACKSAMDTFSIEAGLSIKHQQNIWQDGGALQVKANTAGSIDSIYFEPVATLSKELDDDEILIRVEVASLNFKDLLIVLGSVPWGNPGAEGAGTVERVGSNVQNLQVGDQVFYITTDGGWTNFVRINNACAHKIPVSMSMIEAATMPAAYSTAMMCLMGIGRLQQDDSVLIHAASGAVGQACITIAQHVGATVFATAGTEKKREFLTQNFNIPTDHIFSSRTSDFKDGVLLVTKGRGVDVVVNSLSDDLLQNTWDLIADNGRFVEIGKKDFLQNSHLPMRHFSRNVTFSGLDIAECSKKPAFVNKWLAKITELVNKQVIGPIKPVTAIPISQMATGLRKLQTGQNIGKIVFTLGQDEEVLAACPSRLVPPSGKLFNQDATYLITGGTGGIGRGLAEWMIKEGAKNIVLLGRSGSANPKVAELLQNFQDSDIRLRALACDVGSRPGLVNSMKAMKDLPPIRGVIHGALYLNDGMFMSASFDDWQKVRSAKIDAAWHLHELLPNLDFFISLASFVGIIGHFGQSIYAGTSTFLDAFTQFRLSQGLHSVCISLPVVEGVGYVAERGIGTQLIGGLGGLVTEQQVYQLVKGAILGPSSGLNHHGRSQPFVRIPMKDVEEENWERYRFAAAMRRRPEDEKLNLAHNADSASRNLQSTEDLDVLMAALSEKLSAMTMIDREDITPEKDLKEYGLDSLVAVELRNWIRRELGAVLPLKAIVGADNLKGLLQVVQSSKVKRRGEQQ